jgi:hypothetical protein
MRRQVDPRESAYNATVKKHLLEHLWHCETSQGLFVPQLLAAGENLLEFFSCKVGGCDMDTDLSWSVAKPDRQLSSLY